MYTNPAAVLAGQKVFEDTLNAERFRLAQAGELIDYNSTDSEDIDSFFTPEQFVALTEKVLDAAKKAATLFSDAADPHYTLNESIIVNAASAQLDLFKRLHNIPTPKGSPTRASASPSAVAAVTFSLTAVGGFGAGAARLDSIPEGDAAEVKVSPR